MLNDLVECNMYFIITKQNLASSLELTLNESYNDSTIALSTDGVNQCLEIRYWFYFLSSSLIVFLSGLIAILSWRILEQCIACCVAGPKSRDPVLHESLISRYGDTQKYAKVGLATRIKWKCEKMISGQTFFGKMLVSKSEQ